jgi:DMSO reductase anchor subunit
MTRVYLLRTIPVWNSAATPLEFGGSTLLLGGALGAVSAAHGAALQPGGSPAFIASEIGMVLGLILKLAAIAPSLAAEQAARVQTWYETPPARLSPGWTLVIRIGLNISGILLILTVPSYSGSIWLCLILSLICLGTAEVLGRQYFYHAYRRIGL